MIGFAEGFRGQTAASLKKVLGTLVFRIQIRYKALRVRNVEVLACYTKGEKEAIFMIALNGEAV